MSSPALHVSVVLPFGDDEEVIGTACVQLADHLRQRNVAFEILAVDEGSTDNAHNLLHLLRAHVPELRILFAAGVGHGYRVGAGCARGRVLWLLNPGAALAALPAFGRALDQIESKERDVVLVAPEFMVMRRMRCLPLFEGRSRGGLGALYHRARRSGLEVEAAAVADAAPASPQASARTRRVPPGPGWVRLWQALVPARSRA